MKKDWWTKEFQKLVHCQANSAIVVARLCRFIEHPEYRDLLSLLSPDSSGACPACPDVSGIHRDVSGIYRALNGVQWR